jgi:hypothetical protein
VIWPPEPEVVEIRPGSELARVIAETVARINAVPPGGRRYPAKLKAASGIEAAPAGETGTGSTVGESPIAESETSTPNPIGDNQ